jgi:hypothetical protein
MTGLPFWATLSALCAGGIRAEMLNRPAPISNTRFAFMWGLPLFRCELHYHGLQLSSLRSRRPFLLPRIGDGTAELQWVRQFPAQTGGSQRCDKMPSTVTGLGRHELGCKIASAEHIGERVDDGGEPPA